MQLTKIAAIMSAPLVLSGCGGGDGPEANPRPDSERAGKIIRSADTLLLSSTDIHVELGGRHLDSTYDTWTCSGTNCVSRLTGAAVTLGVRRDNLETLAVSETGRVTYGKQAGFDTVRTYGGIDVRDVFEQSGVRIATISGDSAESFGFWGEHGIAATMGVEATISGSLSGTRFDGVTLEVNSGVVAGRASGSNPSRSATWIGIARAYDPNGHTGSGTAKLTANLSSRPTVDADIRIGGNQIGSAAWSRIPLANGRFETGSGLDDRIVGHFHGPRHEEAYGTFDTRDWSGVFGAKTP